MGKKSPAFSWYPKDWLSDGRTRRMTLEERGAYRELLDYAWLEGGVPADLGELAQLLGVTSKKMAQLWQKIGLCWTERDGRYVQERQELERSKQKSFAAERSASGKKGAERRWSANSDGSAIREPMAKNGFPSASASATTEEPPTPPSGGVTPPAKQKLEDMDTALPAGMESLTEAWETWLESRWKVRAKWPFSQRAASIARGLLVRHWGSNPTGTTAMLEKAAQGSSRGLWAPDENGPKDRPAAKVPEAKVWEQAQAIIRLAEANGMAGAATTKLEEHSEAFQEAFRAANLPKYPWMEGDTTRSVARSQFLKFFREGVDLADLKP